jgi:hypothetical protein
LYKFYQRSFSGEHRNKATAFIDLSVIYGNNLYDGSQIRSSQGKIFLSPNQTLPVDKNGRYTTISIRLLPILTVHSWAILVSRFHNLLAEGLAALNPHWDDERLYQEAKRINIATLQHIGFSDTPNKRMFGKFKIQAYDDTVDPSITHEFQNTVMRFIHFLIPSNHRTVDSQGVISEKPQSQLIGNIGLLEKNPDDYLRGVLNQSIFNDFMTDEVNFWLSEGLDFFNNSYSISS